MSSALQDTIILTSREKFRLVKSVHKVITVHQKLEIKGGQTIKSNALPDLMQSKKDRLNADHALQVISAQLMAMVYSLKLCPVMKAPIKQEDQVIAFNAQKATSAHGIQ